MSVKLYSDNSRDYWTGTDDVSLKNLTQWWRDLISVI